MDNKQTSIEWLVDKLIDYNQSQDTGMINIKIPAWEYFELKYKAQQMHKEEIGKALDVGYQIADGDVRFKHIQTCEQYYQETYERKTI